MEEYFHALLRGERKQPWHWCVLILLRILSGVYFLVVWLRNTFFDLGWLPSYAVTVPVVSIGNLTVGGTGKTPFVAMTANWFRKNNEAMVAILSRGYRGEQGQNDEAMVLEENLPDVPHLQGSNRLELAKIAVDELESEILLLDDGFQHRRLRRDLDIVLIDATCPWGYGYLLPGGLLRESTSGLRRAGVIALTRTDMVSEESLQQLETRIKKNFSDKILLRTVHRATTLVNDKGETLPLEALVNRNVLAFCGIGNPQAFRKTLEQLGADVSDLRVFPDHHSYTKSDIDGLRTWARQHATDCIVVTTQKDLVKIRVSTLGDRQLWALRIELEITRGNEDFDRKLKELLP